MTISKDQFLREIKDKGGRKLLVYKCIICPQEINIRPNKLNEHSGKCHKCTIRKRPFEQKYNSFIDSTIRTNKKRNRLIEINLTYEEYLEFTKIKNCTYCNIEIEWQPHYDNKHKTRGSNLDRKDSSLGYDKNNCVVCCAKCNFIKNKHFSHEEFLAIIKLIKEMRKT